MNAVGEKLAAAGRFKPGYLFPEIYNARNAYVERKTIDEQNALSPKGGVLCLAGWGGRKEIVWDIWDTPLAKYTQTKTGKDRNFEDYLTGQLQAGRRLRVLDVGVGSGLQWSGMIESWPNLDFYATALTLTWVTPQLHEKTTVCSAAELHKFFPPNFFDLIITNHGTQYQEKEALENGIYVLKTGGAIMAVVHCREPCPVSELPLHARHYTIIEKEVDATGPSYYHIMKKNDNAV